MDLILDGTDASAGVVRARGSGAGLSLMCNFCFCIRKKKEEKWLEIAEIAGLLSVAGRVV